MPLGQLQLVGLELALKLAGGLVLLSFPLTAIKVLGLPKSESACWPRLLGAVLIGLAIATYMDASARLGHGLGLAGSMVINFSASFALICLLVLGEGASWRGRVLLWGVAAGLLILALVEIAYI